MASNVLQIACSNELASNSPVSAQTDEQRPQSDKILFKKPSIFSKPIANIKKGRLLLIKKCENEWCKVETGVFKGWVDNKNLWGYIK